ncbi:hypothetical protein FD755_006430 [Muntiacus reevesi]|uniref:GNAS complex locus n=1 Tax=Muntiacus reevesi TaxID=9886 RepID=A0A5J5N1S3_MUNRE|nr:hypothetical protein FD755_006430 [Muntiacus reevesi]
MGCLGNSKTEDQRNEEKAQREANKKIEKQLQKDKQVYRATHRLLLLERFVKKGEKKKKTCTNQNWKMTFVCKWLLGLEMALPLI